MQKSKTVIRFSLALEIIRDLIREVRSARRLGYPELVKQNEEAIATFFRERHTTIFNQYGWPECIKYSTPKPDVYFRSAFDKESRSITRYAARRILQMNRRTARRIDGGWKFVHGFEPAVITKLPCKFEVNF